MNVAKDEEEFKQKLNSLKGLSAPDQTIAIKKFIHEQAAINKKMATRQLKVKSDTELCLKQIEEAKSFKASARPPKVSQEEADVLAEFKKLVGGSFYKAPQKEKLPISGAGS